MSDDTRRVQLTAWRGERAEPRHDQVAHEEPLELQVDGQALAVLMRTPGHDEELGTGFLLTEGVIGSVAELVSLQHCTVVPTPEAEDNVLQARLTTRVDLERFRRHTFASSSCGVCGKATIENALRVARPIDVAFQVERATLLGLPEALAAEQRAFLETGGVHAAALFDARGALVVVREDVGRHNAVDKVVGWAAREAVDVTQHGLLVSGRVSFELVQKCVAARIALLAGVSAPTSLAVRMAEALGVTLVAFLRGDAMNVYTPPRALR